MNGAWPASTPKAPSEPGASTWSTSPENSSRSGETKEKCSLSAISTLSLRRQFLGLGHGVLDGADEEERLFRQMVVFAVAHRLERADGVLELDEHAGRIGELLGDVERLGQEAADLAGSGDGQLVLFRQLVHAEDGDDVLERLV